MALLLAPQASANVFTSLSAQGKWKSFGVEDWSRFDPFERATPGAQRRPYDEWRLRPGGSQTQRLFDLIAFAEAGSKGYDAVHHSATRRPKPPTQMTLGEIFTWIKATPGQHHAIGRYQMIPSTLAALVRRAGLAPSTRFSPKVQDRLGLILLEDAGLAKFRKGRISLSRFMNNLARIWAGLPLRNGRSAYAGIAGNRATISRKFYEAEMKKIFLS
jgi:hypothetical protein